MTKKRFTLVKCVYNNWGLIDRSLEDVDQLVLIHTSKSSVSELVNVLNQLNDDNEQLKSEIEKLSYANEDLLSEKRNWQRMSDEYCKLSDENEQLKQQLDDNLQFLIRASKRLGFESLDHLLYTLDKGEITGYSTANWEKGDVE